MEVGRGWMRGEEEVQVGAGRGEEEREVVLVVVCSRGDGNIPVFYGHISGGIIRSLASAALMC